MAAIDPDFSAHLRVLRPQAQAKLIVRAGEVVNTSTRTVGGHLVPARDLNMPGDLHLGDLPRPSAP
jgi:hypothetical protein